jgi:hypothetical protein
VHGTIKPSIVIRAMLGLGDNLHVRAAVREWVKTHEVHVEAPIVSVFHDFVAAGTTKVYLRDTNLHAQKKQLELERHLFTPCAPPPQAVRRHIGYNKPDIDRWGSIPRAVMGMAGIANPPIQPDFSMPVPDAWRDAARALLATWPIGDRRLLIYRPVVLRREWDSTARNPDPAAYAALFAELCDKFFVVSIANLEPGKEWIVGAEQDADVKLHKGELPFQTLAGLWAQADLVMSPAGMGVVLAQAVGTPVVAVYGRRESFRTTDAAGAHLAPTLGIDPDETCDCHSLAHYCKRCRTDLPKKITLEPAIDRVREFVAQNVGTRKHPCQ